MRNRFYKSCVASGGELQTLIRVLVCDPIIICFNQIPPLTIYNNCYYSTGQTQNHHRPKLTRLVLTYFLFPFSMTVTTQTSSITSVPMSATRMIHLTQARYCLKTAQISVIVERLIHTIINVRCQWRNLLFSPFLMEFYFRNLLATNHVFREGSCLYTSVYIFV